jgi:hypothetical protein
LTNDPHKHLEAAKAHLHARAKQAGIASYHDSLGAKAKTQAAQEKAESHGTLAKDHAMKAANLIQNK